MEDPGRLMPAAGILVCDGRVQLDAMIMDGATLRRCGGAVETAQPDPGGPGVMEHCRRCCWSASAERFMSEHGFPAIDNAEPVSPRSGAGSRGAVMMPLALRCWPNVSPVTSDGFTGHDTVSAVA
jgi:isoaspartyl peptidase/L-asparaginase-like protein (Ntn-hydrolase superfamily)